MSWNPSVRRNYGKNGRKLTRKYLQKKSLGMVWKRQKSSLLELLCAIRGRPARSTGGHSKVHVGDGTGATEGMMSIARKKASTASMMNLGMFKLVSSKGNKSVGFCSHLRLHEFPRRNDMT